MGKTDTGSCHGRHLRTAPGDGIDVPCAARIYDAFLGGGHNFGVEREFAERLEQALPGITEVFRENRAFVRRATEHLISSGIRQFLDLGSGIPTIGHVHEVADRRTSDFRVLYVDDEPLTVAHSRSRLESEPRARIICADMRDPDSVLASREATELLDPSRPVGLLMSAVLHFLPEDPRPVVDAYKDALAPGSHLALSHITNSAAPDAAALIEQRYATTSDPLVARSTGRIDSLFEGMAVLAPGTCRPQDWRPDPDQRPAPARYPVLHGGVARKR